MIGWPVGLRFTRDIVRYAARALPTILAAPVTLIALCAGLAGAVDRRLSDTRAVRPCG